MFRARLEIAVEAGFDQIREEAPKHQASGLVRGSMKEDYLKERTTEHGCYGLGSVFKERGHKNGHSGHIFRLFRFFLLR
jgi:hypothetical protein